MKKHMKLILLPVLFISLIFLYGCPVSMDFPADYPGTQKIDKALIGTWTCVMDSCSDLQVVTVKKKTDYSYDIEVVEKGDSYFVDDLFFEGFVTRIDGKNFLYAKGESTAGYFLYHYEVDGKSLSLFDVSLIEGGKDAVTSTEAFRAEISASLKKEGCLTERIDFKRK
jgi:hypothetical protein